MGNKMYNKFHIDRAEEIDTIKELIKNRDYYKENSQEGISILINGSWGSGKTTFINDLCGDSELNKEYKIIKYDSFEYDFYDNPYIPLFSFLHEKLTLSADIEKLIKITSNQIGKVLLNASYTVINTFFKINFGKNLDDIKKQIEEIKENYDESNNAYKEFKELEKIKEDIKNTIQEKTKAKPIIFIIDELDRCRPTFAIGTLEILKYFLDIKNFIILLSLDEKQLQESVKTIYGQGMNSDIYFSKFFDYKFNLNRLTFSKIVDQASITNMPDILPSVDHIFTVLNVSVRDSHKIFIEFLRKYKIYNKSDNNWTKHQCVFILFMITIKNIDLMFYNSIINLNFSNFKKVIEQNDNIDKKKYLEVLKFSLFGDDRIESCIKNLIRNFDENYIDIKYLSYHDMFRDNEFERKRDILRTMNLFLPQVIVDKTYMDNLLEILNK